MGRDGDTAVESLRYPFIRVERAGECLGVDRANVTLDPAGGRVVDVDQGRVGTEVEETTAYHVGRPAVADGPLVILGGKRAVCEQ
jgi:hypothetical protein